MFKSHLPSVETKATRSRQRNGVRALGGFLVPAASSHIERFSHKRMVGDGGVDADLVSAAGVWFSLNKSGAARLVAIKDAEIGSRRFAVGTRRVNRPKTGVQHRTYRRLDGKLIFRDQPFKNGKIGMSDTALLKRSPERREGGAVLSQEKQTAGPAVETMNGTEIAPIERASS